MTDLVECYRRRRHKLKERLNEFRNAGKNKNVFEELCFCILTPQSKAVNCDKAIKELQKRNLLATGSARRIAATLRRFTRFHNKKACYLVGARKIFSRKRLKPDNPFETREWLVRNIKGLGYKEASHFLRNIGYGQNMAILDRHILGSLKTLGVIRKTPSTLTKRRYLEIEDKMRAFAKQVGIPLEELDLLFWSSQTGFVFK